MKGYQSQLPSIVVGGCAGDFLGEYMAGGVLVVLGIGRNGPKSCVGDYLGTGMHGGTIYVCGQVDIDRCGKEVGIKNITLAEEPKLMELVTEFCEEFGLAREPFEGQPFAKVIPVSSRPYGRFYAY
jgi:glutamate synthase domain-containing protein 3